MTALETVERFLHSHPRFLEITGHAIAQSLRSVLGDRSLDDVSSDAKAMIGSALEGHFLPAMGLPKQDKGIDTLIYDIEVDVKHSIGTSWMVGPECVGHVCLLFQTNYASRTYSVGLVVASPEHLTSGKNRDQKVSFNSKGKAAISWIVREQAIPDLPVTVEDRLSSIENKIDRILAMVGGETRP